jgi:hypothetical protein
MRRHRGTLGDVRNPRTDRLDRLYRNRRQLHGRHPASTGREREHRRKKTERSRVARWQTLQASRN